MRATGWGLLAALCILLPSVLCRPPTRQQELRVLVTARNMAESGNWLRPEFQNQARFRKPPLAYWLTAASMKLTGNGHQAAPARLPFVLAALGVWWLLRQLAGPQGDPASLLLLASFGFWRFGGLAETDFLQVAGICLAMFGWQRKAGGLAGLGIGLGLLAKSPAAVAIPWIVFLVMQRKVPRDRRFWLPTLLLPLLAAVAWLALLGRDPAGPDALGRELSATFVKSAHAGTPFYYLYTLPKLLTPALLVLLIRKTRCRVPLLPMIWLAVGFMLLTLTPSKQDHYALLLLPPAVWILAAWTELSPPRPAWTCLTALTVGLGLAISAAVTEDAANARFLGKVRPLTGPQGTLHVVGINSAIFDFHLGRHVENTDSAEAALTRAKPGDWVIVVQKAGSWDAGSTQVIPLVEADDGFWIRRLYGVTEPAE